MNTIIDQDSTPTLREGESLVYVQYDPIWSREEVLLYTPSLTDVSNEFDGNRFERDESACPPIDYTARNCVMLIKQFGLHMYKNEIIHEMKEYGYRPAIHLEAYAFGLWKYNLLDNEYNTVALGDFVRVRNETYVTVLRGNEKGFRKLIVMREHRRWDAKDRFLFVREN